MEKSMRHKYEPSPELLQNSAVVGTYAKSANFSKGDHITSHGYGRARKDGSRKDAGVRG